MLVCLTGMRCRKYGLKRRRKTPLFPIAFFYHSHWPPVFLVSVLTPIWFHLHFFRRYLSIVVCNLCYTSCHTRYPSYESILYLHKMGLHSHQDLGIPPARLAFVRPLGEVFTLLLRQFFLCYYEVERMDSVATYLANGCYCTVIQVVLGDVTEALR